MESPLTTLGVRSKGQPTCAAGLLAFFWIKDCSSLSASAAGGPTGGMAIFFEGLTLPRPERPNVISLLVALLPQVGHGSIPVLSKIGSTVKNGVRSVKFITNLLRQMLRAGC